jgi:hypothetical protein
MDAELELLKDRLTPAQRDEVQAYFLRRYLASRRVAQPERRASVLARLPPVRKVEPSIRPRWPMPWRRGAGDAVRSDF